MSRSRLRVSAIHLALLGMLALPACERRSERPAGQGETEAVAQDPAIPKGAIAFVDAVWTQHFKAEQGFSVDDLRAHRRWFTPRLYDLLLRDMSDPSGDIGYIDFDLLTAAQDDVDGFALGRARQGHDTVYVPVTIHFGGEGRPLTVAVVSGGGRWQIADIVYPEGDLVAGLVGAQTPAAAAGSAVASPAAPTAPVSEP